MKFTYNFTIEDWMAFQKHYLDNSTQFRRTRIATQLMLPVIFSIFIIFDLVKGQVRPTSIAVFAVISGLFAVFYPKRLYNRTLSRMRKMVLEGDNTGLLGEHTVEMTEDCIQIQHPQSEQKITWAGIKKAEETDHHIFLFTSGVAGIIIPKEKLRDQQDTLTFLKEMINRKVRNNKMLY